MEEACAQDYNNEPRIKKQSVPNYKDGHVSSYRSEDYKNTNPKGD